MSRPKYYWNGIVKKMIMQYPELQNDTSTQAAIYKNAIDTALEETKQLPDGELRIKAIQKVYLDKTMTIEGVAIELNYSFRTMQRWLNSFVNLVGKKAGF